MIGTVDFNMILELNHLLKKKGYDYSVHSIGGCASCGLNLRCEGEESDLEDVMKVINDFLKNSMQQKSNITMLIIAKTINPSISGHLLFLTSF